MIHLVTLNPALDLELYLRSPRHGKIGEVLFSDVESGGKALNIARYLKKSRVPFTVWSGTGGGDHPTHLLYRSLLEREGLAVNFLSRQAPVRLNVVVERNGRREKFNHPGFELDLTGFQRLDRTLRRDDLLVLTGRLPQGMNPKLYASWAAAYGAKGVRVAVDTSGVPLREALKAGVWFFKVNLFEFNEGLGKGFRDLDQVAKFIPVFLKAGLLHGAVTNGAEGAVLWNGPVACRVKPSQKLSGKMVVGAGDGFLAGYLKAYREKKNFWDCARTAGAFAATVARTGIMKFDADLAKKNLKRTTLQRL
ncbi:MAG TPA: PfkB family carbohydrate kinase [bacterium]|nr:PfkB family carbohydrate kinase [bacterium]